MHILVIDDDADALQGLVDLLSVKVKGAQITASASALRALDLIQQQEFDVVISDVKMPEMDGLTLMGRMQALKPYLPVLLVSGHSDRNLALRALNEGAHVLMPKPLDRDYLAAWVHRAFKAGRISQELEEAKGQLNAVMEAVPCLVVMTNPSGTILAVNHYAQEKTGYQPEELIGKNILEFIPDSWQQAVSEQLIRQNIKGTCRPHRNPWRIKSGEERMIEWRCRSYRSPRYTDTCVVCAVQ
ncbi:MAG: response regulator [Nitrospiraceae bacterium]|nr:response regulator [Nitrospiraceae bacterium]